MRECAVEAVQAAVRRRYGATPAPARPSLKVGIWGSGDLGIARHVRDGGWPLNGLRHPPAGGTTGWYLWAGEDPLPRPPTSSCPCTWPTRQNGAPRRRRTWRPRPGWRFVPAPGHEDVRYDAALLTPDATQSRRSARARARERRHHLVGPYTSGNPDRGTLTPPRGRRGLDVAPAGSSAQTLRGRLRRRPGAAPGRAAGLPPAVGAGPALPEGRNLSDRPGAPPIRCTPAAPWPSSRPPPAGPECRLHATIAEAPAAFRKQRRSVRRSVDAADAPAPAPARRPDNESLAGPATRRRGPRRPRSWGRRRRLVV